VGAEDDGFLAHGRDAGIGGGAKDVGLGTVAADAHGKVNVPGELFEAARGGFVHVVVFAAAVAVAVPVANGVLDGEDAHPLVPDHEVVEGGVRDGRGGG